MITIDCETYSDAGYYISSDLKIKSVGTRGGLPEVGLYPYVEHPSFRVLCLHYRDGVSMNGLWKPWDAPPRELLDRILRGEPVEAHNAGFEFVVWNKYFAHGYKWPEIKLEQLYCSAAKCRRYSLPGALGLAAQVVGGVQKDKAGTRLIQKLTRPHTPTKKRAAFAWTPETAPEDFQALYDYCARDTEAEADLSRRVPDLTPYERSVWLVDQRINNRGVYVDRESLAACLRLLRESDAALTAEFKVTAGGAVSTVNENQNFKDWLGTRGIITESVDKGNVERILSGPAVPPDVRRALELRQQLGGANNKKLYTLERRLSKDGRLRNSYLYCGADRTGRWSSFGVQLQNVQAGGPESKTHALCGRIVGKAVKVCPTCELPGFHERGEWGVDEMEQALKDIRENDYKTVSDIWGHAGYLLSGCLRGLFVAPPDRTLVCADFSAIEAVALACLSRCQWRIDVFNTHGKIYETTASQISGVPLEEMLEYKRQTGQHHKFRKKLGKIPELACFTPHTQVLTKNGYKPIFMVDKNDFLWDGVEWVQSNGAIYKGRKRIISLDGIGVTPDHPISLGLFWKAAKTLALRPNTLKRALATGSENLPSCAIRKTKKSGGLSLNVLAATRNILSVILTCTRGKVHGAVRAAGKRLKTPGSNSIVNTGTSCRTRSIGGDSLTGCGQPSPDATARRIANIGITARAELKCVTSGGVKTARGFFFGIQSPYPDGMRQSLKWTVLMLTVIMNRGISVLFQGGKICSIKDRFLRCKRKLTNLRDVYDIVNAGPRNRFTIKTHSGHLIVHNSGYGGWVNAWKAFGADKFFDSDDEIKQAIITWRERSPEIVEFWGGQHRQVGAKPWDSVPELYGLEGAAVSALLNPGQCFQCNDIGYGYQPDRDVLFCRLPSGRFLHYHRARLTMGVDHFRRPAYRITFEGYNSNPAKGKVGWITMDTYGGRLAENVTQAVSADIQAEALVRAEDDGFPIVMHTHDEMTAEVPRARADLTLDRLIEVMQKRPSWAAWWPIRAAGWTGHRYRKD